MSRMYCPSGEVSNHSDAHLCTGYSDNPSPRDAAKELQERIGYKESGLILVFVSSCYDRIAIAQELRHQFPDRAVIGCTTAGEIGPMGYGDNGVAGVSFGREDILFEVGLLEHVSKVDSAQCQRFAYMTCDKLLKQAAMLAPSQRFALLLIDGLSNHEEVVARAVHDGLGGIPMVGGSAGDGMAFRNTGVLFRERFYNDAALLLVAASPHRVTTFKTQHFIAGDRRLVLTGAIPERRIATEINGLPAAQEYAHAVGVDPRLLDAHIFSAHPLLVKIGGADFVRSIRKVNEDGSLTFFCAIDEGIVFNVAERVDLASNLEGLFSDIEQQIGSPRLVLGCDCILRRIEIEQSGTKEQVSNILSKHNVVGFNSYGEQFRGMHVNQTFTGIAISPAHKPSQARHSGQGR